MKQAVISVLLWPKKEIVANCPDCRKELVRVEYEGYADYHRKRKQAENSVAECPNCKAVFQERESVVDIPWGKTIAGDWMARAKDGDFLVWKDGSRYKWRYREYGKETAEIYIALTKEQAQRACTKHRGWKL